MSQCIHFLTMKEKTELKVGYNASRNISQTLKISYKYFKVHINRWIYFHSKPGWKLSKIIHTTEKPRFLTRLHPESERLICFSPQKGLTQLDAIVELLYNPVFSFQHSKPVWTLPVLSYWMSKCHSSKTNILLQPELPLQVFWVFGGNKALAVSKLD